MERDEYWTAGASKSKGGKETGSSVIRAGPGGLSLIEDLDD
jgi:hypothetical protein